MLKEIKDSFVVLGPSQARLVTLYKNAMLWILENHHYKLCELHIFLTPIRFLPASIYGGLVPRDLPTGKGLLRLAA